MENREKTSLLKLNSVELAPNFTIKIPTVGEILDDEHGYYSVVSTLTATPYQYMVQLDDMGIHDFTKISEFELFQMLFGFYVDKKIPLVFGDLDLSDFKLYNKKLDGDEYTCIYSPQNNIEINERVYYKLTDTLRKINNFEKVKGKPGNEHARKYLLEKERKKQKRNAKKPYEPFLEKLVVALVNNADFPYDYDSCMNLSIYRFNQSFKQIQHKISYDNIMIGVYTGNVDTSKMVNKDVLSWVQT